MSLESIEKYMAVLRLLHDAGLGPLLTTKEAAAFLRLRPAAVLRALASGRLKGMRVGSRNGRWRICAEDVARFACDHRAG